ncbi:unnamed protein product, partial [Symbiodinium sp. KB8]
DEVRNLAIQLAADPDYTVFNVSQSNMHDAFERIIAEMEEIINDTLDAEAAVIAKYQACDRTQLTYETAFCTYRTELIDQCSALDNCYSSAVGVFQATKDLILKSNSSRHVAFIAARQVQCYIRVLQSDNLTMAAIEACDYKLVDTSPLALTVPTIPPKPACDVSLVAQHPCGTAWVAKNYQDVTKYWVAEQIAHATCGGLSGV